KPGTSEDIATIRPRLMALERPSNAAFRPACPLAPKTASRSDGRSAPYSAVKAPIETTNPAGTSPTLQPKATGAATQNAAPREYGQRFGAMPNRTRCCSRKDAGREGGGKWSIYITEGLGRGGARIRI